MKLIRGLHNLECHRNSSSWTGGCVLTIGNFDGVHVGHRVILDQVVAQAKRLGLVSRVLIFEPQPLEYFAGNKAPARLTTFQEKVRQLLASGIDSVVCLRFDVYLKSMDAEQFVTELLVSRIDVRQVIVGDDFRFGAQKRGDFELLTHLGQQSGFDVESTQTVLIDDERVSSTRIRAVLEARDFVSAEKLLGRPYSISGRVISGQRLGRQLGFPTANISLKGKVAPLAGVYAVEVGGVLSDGTSLKGVANVGRRPTVGGESPLLEVHILDFNDDIYFKKISVMFRHHIRDEQKFSDLAALTAQIANDIATAREFFS